MISNTVPHRIVLALYKHGELSTEEIAQHAKARKEYVHKILVKLRFEGYVYVSRVENRRKYYRLTKKGLSAV